MSEIENGLLDAQAYFLQGVAMGNKTFARIAGQQLRAGNPAVINQYRKNCQTIDKLSDKLEKERIEAHEKLSELGEKKRN